MSFDFILFWKSIRCTAQRHVSVTLFGPLGSEQDRSDLSEETSIK